MRSIRGKFLLLNLVSLLLCALMVGGVSLAAISASQLSAAQEILTLTCRTESAELEAQLYGIRNTVELFCELADEQLDSLEQLREEESAAPYFAQTEKYMGQLAQLTPGICAYYFRVDPALTDGKGGFLYSKKPGKDGLQPERLTDLSRYSPTDTEHVGWYYQPQQAGHAVWMEPYFNRNLNMYMISYVVPLYRDGQFWAVAGMDIDFGVVLARLRALSPYATGYAALISDQGAVYYHPRLGVGGQITEESAELSELAECLAAPYDENNRVGSFRYKRGDVGMELSYSRLQNGMVLLLCAERREIKAPLVALFKVVAALILVICAAAALVLVLLSNRITRPLKKLTLAADEIARGNMDVELPEPGRDEVGLLTRSFEVTVTSLRTYISLMYNMAYSDALTHVKNKTAYVKAVEELQERIDRGEADFGLLMLDVNNLKHVNDRYGHERGDEYLRANCRMVCTVFKHSPVYRVGGDEFVVVLSGRDKERFPALLAEMNRAMHESRSLREPWRRLSLAKGVSFWQPGDRSPEEVLKRADEAMYADKRRMKKRPQAQKDRKE